MAWYEYVIIIPLTSFIVKWVVAKIVALLKTCNIRYSIVVQSIAQTAVF
jgi:hypothetical protein